MMLTAASDTERPFQVLPYKQVRATGKLMHGFLLQVYYHGM